MTFHLVSKPQVDSNDYLQGTKHDRDIEGPIACRVKVVVLMLCVCETSCGTE